MSKKSKQVSEFSLEGRFLGFELAQSYKIKRLRLATAAGEVDIKLSKEARASVVGALTPGDWLSVRGEKSVSAETGEVKHKAYSIRQHLPAQSANQPISASVVQSTPRIKPPLAILVCQKSDCMKRGGRGLCQALQSTLDDRGLTDQVAIKGTGCMKQCKAGPNLVMPDKTRYSRITASDVPALIDKHLQPAIATPTALELVTTI